MRLGLALLILIVALAIAALELRDYVRRHPQDVPWTSLDLRHPVGAFTARKLIALQKQPAQCRALLRDGGIDEPAAPAISAQTQCGYDDGIRVGAGPGRPIAYAPAGLVTSCPVAVALAIWERDVVQPAARKHFGRTVEAIEQAGSYSCRRLYGRADGPFSEHATADAIDIAAFRIAGGKRITVLRDWPGDDGEAAFLRDVRDGACDLFATVLSPQYNRAHADHLHLDVAERGRLGWTLCR